MPKLYGFNEADTRRIGAVVKAFEDGNNGKPEPSDMAAPGGSPQAIVAILTARDATDKRFYSWSQARNTGSGFNTYTGALSGTTTTRPAIDTGVTNSDTGPSKVGQAVILVRGKSDIGGGAFADCWYVAATKLTVGYNYGAGTLKYQCLQMAADFAGGGATPTFTWDFVRAHA
jgi:hypothetical protein